MFLSTLIHICMDALIPNPAESPTSVQKPLPHSLGDIEGQPLRGAPRLHIPATEVPLLCYVLIRPQDLCQKERERESTSGVLRESVALRLSSAAAGHILIKQVRQ